MTKLIWQENDLFCFATRFELTERSDEVFPALVQKHIADANADSPQDSRT
jgi:hypothetical protein